MNWTETTVLHPTTWSARVERDLRDGPSGDASMHGLRHHLRDEATLGRYNPAEPDDFDRTFDAEFDAACASAREQLAALPDDAGPQTVTLTPGAATVVPLELPGVAEVQAREDELERQRVAATQPEEG